MQFIESLTKEELITLMSLVIFGAAVTVNQDHELETSVHLEITKAVEELNTDNCIDDLKQIVELAIKFSNYMKEKANA